MKNSKYYFLLILLVALLLPASLALAAGNNTGPITNPLAGGGVTDVPSLIKKVITFLLGLVGILALLAFVVGGFQYILSFGDDKKIESAKGIIKAAAIGVVLVMLSFAIFETVNFLLG